jgi:hypothetical protein
LAKSWNLAPDEVFFSFDATNLFPSIPIKDVLQITRTKLENDENLSLLTKLGPDDIINLMLIYISVFV